jgi:hypothetical protein
MLQLKSERDLQKFIASHAQQHLEDLQPLVERMTRQRLWEQLSMPLRAKLLGLILGDGHVSASDAFIGLQVMLVKTIATFIVFTRWSGL